MGAGKFVTVINCMDGRVQRPVSDWMINKFSADYVDTITEAGPDGLMGTKIPGLIDSIKARVLVSVEKHGSKVVAIVGHSDCAGNPVDEPTHFNHVRAAMKEIESWQLSVAVIGLWVNSDWQVEEIGAI